MSVPYEVLAQMAKDYLVRGHSPLAAQHPEEWATLIAEIEALTAQGKVVGLLD